LAFERRKEFQKHCIPWLVNQLNKVMFLENGEEEIDAISELISEINGFGSKFYKYIIKKKNKNKNKKEK